MYVKWGSTLSSKFQVTNGVRQGGVLSPLLFNVYVNEPSELLNKSGIGGSMGGTIINHMLYADDICIFFTRKILFEKSSKTYSYINIYR